MKSIVSHVGENKYEWTFNGDGTCFCNEEAIAIEMHSVSANRISVLVEGKSFDAAVSIVDTGYEVLINGILYKIEVEVPSVAAARKLVSLAHGQPLGVEVRSPMPGMVVRLEVSEGSIVEAGDGLLILEAMKMENEIKSKGSGTVKRVMVSDRQIVEKGQLLLVIQ